MLNGTILLCSVSTDFVTDGGSSRVDLPGYLCVPLEGAPTSSSTGWDDVANTASLSEGAALGTSFVSAIARYTEFL